MFRNVRSYKIWHYVKLISESATFALLLSIIFFGYEMIQNMTESKEMTDNLVKIQNSLTTKYLGIFPNYMPAINKLFAEASNGDSIIIFEDVLYYGFKSKPEEFKSFNKHLLTLRNGGSHVIVAYYNPNSIVFHRMAQESRFPTYITNLQKERKYILDSLNNLNQNSTHIDFQKIDSTLSEKYFAMERKNNYTKFCNDVKSYLEPIQDHEITKGTRVDQDIYSLCGRIDSIKQHYLNKNENNILFTDYQNMYYAITDEIIKLYKNYDFELIPLEDYLTMSCWMAGNKIIIAFPSKYNTDEIGFSSQDPAFSRYILTMLDGVKR